MFIDPQVEMLVEATLIRLQQVLRFEGGEIQSANSSGETPGTSKQLKKVLCDLFL